MCEICGQELHYPFQSSRRKFILGAAAIGLAFTDPATAKGKRKEETTMKRRSRPSLRT